MFGKCSHFFSKKSNFEVFSPYLRRTNTFLFQLNFHFWKSSQMLGKCSNFFQKKFKNWKLFICFHHSWDAWKIIFCFKFFHGNSSEVSTKMSKYHMKKRNFPKLRELFSILETHEKRLPLPPTYTETKIGFSFLVIVQENLGCLRVKIHILLRV